MNIDVHQRLYNNNEVNLNLYSNHEFIFIVLVVNVLFFLFHLIEIPKNIARSEKIVRSRMSGESDEIMTSGLL